MMQPLLCRIRWWAPFGMILIGLLGASPSAAAEPVDLEGTWYVLIHYQDPKTANPDAMRWKDLVWVFKQKGTRLEWTEYPTVVFEDTRGRFESIQGNPRSRVLNAWEPNADQRKSIAAGPQVGQRGKKVKTLRGSDANGWQSPHRPIQAGPSIMTYQENLTIEDLGALPLFLRQDVVGNRTTSDRSEGTRYQVETVEAHGSRLVGLYTRDGRQHGSFRMWRTSEPRGVPRKTEDERKQVLPPGFTREDFTRP
ncbi:MAG: hypothetical protein P8M78_00845 [Myxococcota bacterium]|nr:hypothetical protein [Myxococcota bacterium]